MYFIFYIQISCWGGGGWGGISEIHFKKCCYSHLFQKLFCFVSDVTFRCCQHWRSKKWTLSREIRRMSAMNLVIIVKYLYKKMCSTVSKVFFFFLYCRQKITCQSSAHQYLPPSPRPLQVQYTAGCRIMINNYMDLFFEVNRLLCD